MTLVRTKPGEMRFQGLFDNLFSPEFNVLNRSGLGVPGLTFPKVNIREDQEGYHLKLPVPAVAKEEVTIRLIKERLTIPSEKREKLMKRRREYQVMRFS